MNIYIKEQQTYNFKPLREMIKIRDLEIKEVENRNVIEKSMKRNIFL